MRVLPTSIVETTDGMVLGFSGIGVVTLRVSEGGAVDIIAEPACSADEMCADGEPEELLATRRAALVAAADSILQADGLPREGVP